jgi:hypothetical protein
MMWDIEKIIEGSVWVISLLLILFFIPKSQYREAWISFMFMQVPAWLFGLIIVQYGLIQYPDSLIDHAVSTSYTYEFLALPTVSALYNLYYPAGRSALVKLRHALLYPSWMTAIEIILVNYTNLIKYVHWTWYFTWVTVALTLHLSFLFYTWFTQGKVRLF